MKVLLVARSFSRGGAATGAANLGRALEAVGLDVLRVHADGARPAWRVGERLIERALFDAETHCVSFGRPSLDLKALTERHKPDVVQLCDISANTIHPDACARISVPTVHRLSDFWPYHGPAHYAESPGKATPLARRLFAWGGYARFAPTARVAPSDWLADRITGTRPHVIPNAVPPADGIEPRAHPEGPVRLGFISGKLGDPRKGLDRLVAALRALPEGMATLTTFGTGTGPDAGIPARHMGAFDRSELAQVYAQMDILVCPSRMDNSPNTVTEALSFGVPVIGQSGTGMETYIDPECGSLLDFWSDTPPDLGAELMRISGAAPAFSAAALSRANTRFSPKTVGAAYADLYASLTGP